MVKVDDSDAPYAGHRDIKSTILERDSRKEQGPWANAADSTYNYVQVDDFDLPTQEILVSIRNRSDLFVLLYRSHRLSLGS